MGFSLRGFCCCGAWALGCRGFSSGGLQALAHRCGSCVVPAQQLRGMWDLPGPGVESVSPTLASGFFTPEPFQFSSVVWPHGLQHSRPPCPSVTPRVYWATRETLKMLFWYRLECLFCSGSGINVTQQNIFLLRTSFLYLTSTFVHMLHTTWPMSTWPWSISDMPSVFPVFTMWPCHFIQQWAESDPLNPSPYLWAALGIRFGQQR